MEELIHDYLSENFVVTQKQETTRKLQLLTYNVIAKRNSLETYTNNDMVYGRKLLNELVLVFYVEEVRLTTLIEKWAGVDLTWYWKQEEPYFPQVQRVAAQTIASQLVEVKPLAAPSNQLFYLDYKYNENPLDDISGVRRDRILALAQAQMEMFKDELDNEVRAAANRLDIPIGVSSRAPRPDEIERQSWFNPKKDLDNPK